MAQPDPDFIRFFSGDYRNPSAWDRLLEAVEIPGMPSASWDRKAAYLLWVATDGACGLNAPSAPPAEDKGIFD